MLKKLKNLKKKKKIGGGFIILIIIGIMMAFLGFNGLNTVGHKVDVGNQSLKINGDMFKMRMEGVKFFRSGSEEDLQVTNNSLDEIINSLENLKNTMEIEQT